MLSVSEARARILDVFRPVDTELIPLEYSAGRILAGDILAESDLPLFDNSSMDGFALHTADCASPRTLTVVADICAGSVSTTTLHPGECARIMTGAPLPLGAEAVVMVEDTDFNQRGPGAPVPRVVTTNKSVVQGENIRRRGDYFHTGDQVLSSGVCLRAQEIGLLAVLGQAQVLVHRRPRLALLTNGDELLPVEATLLPGKIHESNSYALAVLAETAGVELVRLGVATDTKEDVRSRLKQAVEARVDVIVSSAGVSVGAYDYVKSVVEEDGELDFWKVNVRPGKPLAFGKYHGIPFFGLPGNPVSTFIGFEIFVKPALEKLCGLKSQLRSHQVARLIEPLESDGRESYLRAIVSQEDDHLVARLAGSQDSGNILSLVQANALLIVPSGVKSLPANSEVETWPIT
jgi:molybdopterin molybdotransferase